jgi:nucleoside-triphosphatase THEP1
MIRVAVKDIPAYGRSAGGVIVMRVPENEKVVGFTVVEKEEEEELFADVEAEVEAEESFESGSETLQKEQLENGSAGENE